MKTQSNPQEGKNFTMVLHFSAEEWRRLLILVHAGEWIAGARQDESGDRFEAVAARFFQEASGWGLSGWVQRNEEAGRWKLSPELDEEAHHLLDQYDDDTFWNLLVERLADRDLIQQQGEARVLPMTSQERADAGQTFEERYREEFERHGVERLSIAEDA